jgi:hypothetical protein
MVAKSRSYNERKLRAAWRTFLADNAKVLALLALASTGLALVASVGLRGYVLGALQGALAASYAWAVHTIFIATGNSSRMYGQWGEQNTRDKLKSARRRGVIYGFVDNVEIQGGDVDHLVLAAGGAFALDSKWHGRTITGETLERDRERALAAARRARSILLSERVVMDVIPVIVLWGGQQGNVPAGAIVRGGVHIVSGNHLRAWLSAYPQDAALRRAEARDILAKLRDFQRRVRPGEHPAHV